MPIEIDEIQKLTTEKMVKLIMNVINSQLQNIDIAIPDGEDTPIFTNPEVVADPERGLITIIVGNRKFTIRIGVGER